MAPFVVEGIRPMSQVNADRNLLFAVLALQTDFLSREALIQGMNAWVLEKSKPIGQVLVERGSLWPDLQGVLDSLVDAHLKRHGGDVSLSLASLRDHGPPRLDRSRITDPELQASLAGFDTEYPPTAPGDPSA